MDLALTEKQIQRKKLYKFILGLKPEYDDVISLPHPHLL